MNINNTVLPTLFFYYPLGNTPPVCLTQDLPPEQINVDILLLGCGDARNVLFTCFADNARKLDITCCDIEPGIHARNILLYTLLMDDNTNQNIECIWNIYYCWKIDKKTLQVLETQAQKLLQLSISIDQWYHSDYGACIRFCDARTLSVVRSYWSGFALQERSASDFQNQLQVTIHKAKAYREKMVGKKLGLDMTGLRATFPVRGNPADFSDVSNNWWDYGTAFSKVDATEYNPAFLFSPNTALTLHYNLSPLHGVPLGTCHAPISKGSAFHVENKGSSSIEHIINCAKVHFMQWASAFRKNLANKSILRFFSGDALAFCFTLRNCQFIQTTSMNLSCHNWTNSPLILHPRDYSNKNNAAPLTFDIIDTSNLADHLGPFNMISLTSSLLNHHGFNSLYTETLVQHDSDLADRLANFFGVDIRLMSLMFGLVPPDVFTNATNSVEEDINIYEMMKKVTLSKHDEESTTQQRSRLRWKRVDGFQTSSCIHIEAQSLAKFLIQVHDAMFKHEDPSLMFSFLGLGDSSLTRKKISKQANPIYNRASFASLLSVLKSNIISNWDECLQNMYDGFSTESRSIFNSSSGLDLISKLHVFGVSSIWFPKLNATDMNDSILAPILPIRKDIPDQLCVTVRVGMERFQTFARKEPGNIGSPAVICSFEIRDPVQCENVFSSVQIVFGKWHTRNEGDDVYRFIEEDSSQLFGFSDMFVSVMVPTAMLLQSKKFVPLIKCKFVATIQNIWLSSLHFNLGPDLCFACREMTSNDVFISLYMPGLSALPSFTPLRKLQDITSSSTTAVHLSPDNSQIKLLAKRLTLESKVAKDKLADKSFTVKVDFKSPLTAVISIGGSLELNLKFPIPVSVFNHKVKIARKSSYIEVESCLFNPLKEEAAFFIFPTFLMKTPSGVTIPVPWTSTHVNLEAMPPIDLRNKKAIAWLRFHTSQMFSAREVQIRNSETANDTRTEMKDSLFSLFMGYTGIDCEPKDVFGLTKKLGGVHTLILPSCLRLDLANYTVVLDCAIIHLTEEMMSSGHKVNQFFHEVTQAGFCRIGVTEEENRAWKMLMPALVERCRTWRHSSRCEYAQANEVPLPKGLNEDGEPLMCTCGVGKFPTAGYLSDLIKKIPSLSYMMKRYAIRAAISPIFAVPYVEDCATLSLMHNFGQIGSAGALAQNQNLDHCEKCGSGKRINADGSNNNLLTCSRCKKAKYCSADCQKEDWKKHKQLCKAMKSG